MYELHCSPLQGNYRVELLHREIPVVITGNEFTDYCFLLFWLHFFSCFNNIEIVALVHVMCTGNCQFILQGLKDCYNTLLHIFTGALQGRIILHREIPVVITGNGFAVKVSLQKRGPLKDLNDSKLIVYESK